MDNTERLRKLQALIMDTAERRRRIRERRIKELKYYGKYFGILLALVPIAFLLNFIGYYFVSISRIVNVVLFLAVSIGAGFSAYKIISHLLDTEFSGSFWLTDGIEALLTILTVGGTICGGMILFDFCVKDYSSTEIENNYYYTCAVVTQKHYGGKGKSSISPKVDFKYNLDYSDIYGTKLKIEGAASRNVYSVDDVRVGDTIIIQIVPNVAFMKGISDLSPSSEDKEMYRYPVITQNGEDIGNDTYHWAKKHPESALYHYGLNCAYRAVVTDYQAFSRELTFEAWNFYGDLVAKTIRSDSAYNIGDTLIVSKNLNDTLLPGFIIYPESCKTPSNMDVLSGHGNGFIFHGEIIAKDLLFVELPLYEEYYYEHYKVNDL